MAFVIAANSELSHVLPESPMDKMPFLVEKMLLRTANLTCRAKQSNPLPSYEIERHLFPPLFSRQPAR
jgi:hypothetical protein